MAGQSFAMFGWNWTDVSVLGSLVFVQALMESCETQVNVMIAEAKTVTRHWSFCTVPEAS